jgi:apolipoprotein N-acyltransferase
VVQAAPTGFTAIVQDDGTVRQRTAVSEQRVLYDTIELRDGRTWYVTLGDAPFIAVLALVLLLAVSGARRSRPHRSQHADPSMEV